MVSNTTQEELYEAGVLSEKGELVPGIYDGLSMSAYIEIPARSRSELHDLKRHPEYCAWRRDHPEPEVGALGFGSAVHDLAWVSIGAMSEESFTERYAICGEPIYSKSTNAKTLAEKRTRELEQIGYSAIPSDAKGKEEWDKFKADAAGRVQLDHTQGEALYAINSRIMSSPVFEAMKIADDTRVEQTLVWKDPDTGVWCKARPDSRYTARDAELDIDYRLVVDLKTHTPRGTSSPIHWSFARSVSDYSYHIQGAMILDALDILEGEDQHARFACLPWEKQPPYLGEVCFLSHDALMTGRVEYKRLLRVWALCEEKGLWTSTASPIHTIELPSYHQVYDGERHYVGQRLFTVEEALDQQARGIDPF